MSKHPLMMSLKVTPKHAPVNQAPQYDPITQTSENHASSASWRIDASATGRLDGSKA
jgi:hypothetical protein